MPPDVWGIGAFAIAETFARETATMPTYVYETIPSKRGAKPRQFEVVQKMSDAPLTKDPETGEPVRGVIVGGSGNVMRGLSILSMNNPRKGR